MHSLDVSYICLSLHICYLLFQRLYCLSERNVVAYDMEGNLLFQITE